jgi:DNA-binding transcriptional ArsR family regulator
MREGGVTLATGRFSPLTGGIYKSRFVDMIKLDRHALQFAALGHPARLAIVRAVVQSGVEGTTTTDLQAKLDIPWTTLNHHLDRLVEAGLVATRRNGKFVHHTADYRELRALTEYLWEDCCKAGKGAPNSCC